MNVIISHVLDEGLDSYFNEEEIVSAYEESLEEF